MAPLAHPEMTFMVAFASCCSSAVASIAGHVTRRHKQKNAEGLDAALSHVNLPLRRRSRIVEKMSITLRWWRIISGDHQQHQRYKR
jgi:hypothetical protein